MTVNHRFTSIAVALLAALTGACGGPDGGDAAAASGPRAPETDAEREELSFLVGMTPHHAQAVDMAILCRERADDARLTATCETIIEDQSREIRQMMSWALEWYGTQLSEVQSARYSAEGASGAHGILTDEAMHQLATLSGRAFDLRFTELMIEHHVGAVASAQGLFEVSPHAEVRQLASSIVETQRRETEQMEAWHRAWTGAS